MALNELIQHILMTGSMSCDAETRLQTLLEQREFNLEDVTAMEQLLSAFCRGAIKPIA